MSNLPTNQNCPTCGWEKCAGFHCSECRAPFKSLLGLQIHEGKTHGTGQAPSDPMTDLLHAIEASEPKNAPKDVSEAGTDSTEVDDSSIPKKPAESELSKTEVDTTSIPPQPAPEPNKGEGHTRICGECGYRYKVSEGHTHEPAPAPNNQGESDDQRLLHQPVEPASGPRPCVCGHAESRHFISSPSDCSVCECPSYTYKWPNDPLVVEPAPDRPDDELMEILGEEDWKYTDKPHRIEALYAARFERALGTDPTFTGDDPQQQIWNVNGSNLRAAEARTRWEKGDGRHG